MKNLKAFIIGLTIIASTVITVSCSGSSKNLETPITPGSQAPSLSDIPLSDNVGNHNIFAAYDAEIDPVAKTFTISPSRSPQYHFQLQTLVPNVLRIMGYGFTPHFWADIRLMHPYPGSGIDGFDPRVIAMLPANPGVSMWYPSLNIHGNNQVVMYPDGYTNLFDRSDFEGNVNPFMSYFTWSPNRRWSSTEYIEETMRWDMNLGGFGGPIRFALVVDVSTNYPNPPQPVVDNAQEPVALQVELGPGLTSDGGSALIAVTVLDWQGTGGIGVLVEAPDLFSNTIQLSYNGPGPNPNEYVYGGMITNEYYAPGGEYQFIVVAYDQYHFSYPAREFTATVTNANLNPVEVTPPWLNINPERIAFQWPYAYVAAAGNGLHIFDMSDPAYPSWVGWYDTGGYATDVAVEGNYAYVADYDGVLVILDVFDASSPSLVTIVSGGDPFLGVRVANGYAYIIGGTYFYILDVSPPENTYAVHTSSIGSAVRPIAITNDYAYLARKYSYNLGELLIYDINPANSAHQVGSAMINGAPSDIDISGGYAYIAADSLLAVVDVSPPESANVVNTVYTSIRTVQCIGSFAYASGGSDIINIYYIGTPGSEYLFSQFYATATVQDVLVSDGLGIAANMNGMVTFSAQDPGWEYIIQYLPHVGNALKIDADGQYLFLHGNDNGVNVFSTANPEVPQLEMRLAGDAFSGQSYYKDGYLYYAAYDGGFNIIDMDPLETAHVVSYTSLPSYGREIDLANGYAYIAVDSSGLCIFDVDPPESAYLVKIVDTPHAALDVQYYNGYAYIADGNTGLVIADVEPPTSAFIYKTIDTAGVAEEVRILNGYAYIPDYSNGVVVVDIDPFGSEFIAKTIPTPGNAWAIDVTNDHAFVACDEAGLVVLDINPLDSAYMLYMFPLGYLAFDVELNGNHAYVTDWETGLRIFRLQ